MTGSEAGAEEYLAPEHKATAGPPFIHTSL
jgi:hypothetical protein